MNPLDEARAAYEADSDVRHTLPVLGGTLSIILDRPPGMEGYTPLAMGVAGGEPDTEKDVALLAASIVGVTGQDEKPVTDPEGAEMSPIEVASAIAGVDIPSAERAVYVFFSQGNPPQLNRYQLAEYALLHRVRLAAGVKEAIEGAPEV